MYLSELEHCRKAWAAMEEAMVSAAEPKAEASSLILFCLGWFSAECFGTLGKHLAAYWAHLGYQEPEQGDMLFASLWGTIFWTASPANSQSKIDIFDLSVFFYFRDLLTVCLAAWKTTDPYKTLWGAKEKPRFKPREIDPKSPNRVSLYQSPEISVSSGYLQNNFFVLLLNCLNRTTFPLSYWLLLWQFNLLIVREARWHWKNI